MVNNHSVRRHLVIQNLILLKKCINGQNYLVQIQTIIWPNEDYLTGTPFRSSIQCAFLCCYRQARYNLYISYISFTIL